MSDKIFYPYCEKCNDLLEFEIEPLNFSIKYKCKNDEYHNKSNIYFKTFERFYIKEKELLKCFKCKINLENSEYYNCEECKNTYCNKCYFEDIIINNHKNSNQKENSNRCLTHRSDFIKYCSTCNENICIYCVKNDYIHDGHSIINYDTLMPSLEDIEKLQKKIKEKGQFTNELLEKIENWQQKINQKVEELKQNLKDEISLLEKIIMNFKNTFINHSYFNIFNYINKNVDMQHNNKKLIQFYNTYNFEKQTKILVEVFKYLGKNTENKEEIKKSKANNVTVNLSFAFINKLSHDYFLGCDNIENIYSLHYSELEKKLFYAKKIPFKEKIYSISIYKEYQRIFICLLNSRKIKLIDYDDYGELNQNELEINGDLIINSNHFNKCIQLNEKIIAVSDKEYITIWSENENDFNLLKKIEIFSNTENLLSINEHCFISSQPDSKTLKFFDDKNYEELKVIKNIDCVNDTKSLFNMKNKYIIVKCNNGIGVVLVKTKELIQYIEKFSTSNKNICCSNGKIYILNIEQKKDDTNLKKSNNEYGPFGSDYNLGNPFSNSQGLFSSNNKNTYSYEIKILVADVMNDNFKIIEEYSQFDSNEENLNITYLNKNYLILWGNKKIYVCNL